MMARAMNALMEYTPLFGGLQVRLIDLAAFIIFALSWLSYEEYTNRFSEKNDKNLLMIMHGYRLEWMRQIMRRDNRITDMTCLGNLQRSISFFANASILIALGALSLLSYRDRLAAIIDTIPYTVTPGPIVLEFKIALLAVIFIHAFFKFTWSLRQYNYVCIFIVAAPMSYERIEQHEDYAQRGAKMMTNAGRHFNLGLRAFYYGFAAVAWFFHPVLFMITTVIVIAVLYRREFLSNTYHALRGS